MKKGNDLDRTNDIIDLIKKQKSDYDIDDLLNENSKSVSSNEIQSKKHK